jgi:hypothetical protein
LGGSYHRSRRSGLDEPTMPLVLGAKKCIICSGVLTEIRFLVGIIAEWPSVSIADVKDLVRATRCVMPGNEMCEVHSYSTPQALFYDIL